MTDTRRRQVAGAALAASVVALVAAPLVLPGDYDVLAHTTSEGAGQGVAGAWLPRTGFVLLGAAVLLALPRRGGGVGRALHAVFGGSMVLVAVFASRPWRDSASYVVSEDLLHSIFATAMGFAFAGGVAIAAIAEARAGRRPPLLDALSVIASVAVPLAMVALPDAAGGLQRAMFAVAYLWYGRELVRDDVPAG